MTFDQVIQELKTYGNPTTKTTLIRHGAKEPLFGVKIGDLKHLVKKIKINHPLALELYATNNSDAMYLASLIADVNLITKEELQTWVEQAYWYNLSTYAVANLTAETPYALELAQIWITSKEEQIANAGWSTLCSFLSICENSEANIQLFEKYLIQAFQEIGQAQNRVRYAMNNYIISVGAYVPSLCNQSLEIANKIGKIQVDMGDTACKTPLASEYIQKVITRDSVGKKRSKCR